jgi:hypothetical protein
MSRRSRYSTYGIYPDWNDLGDAEGDFHDRESKDDRWRTAEIAMIDQRIDELRVLRRELHARAKLDCPFVIRGGRMIRSQTTGRLR